MINKQLCTYFVIILILIVIISYSVKFFYINNNNNNIENDHEDINYKFGVYVNPITPKFGENISGIYNITWEVLPYHSNSLPLYVGGNYTDIYYTLDNGSHWKLIIHIPFGHIGTYFYLWNTSDLPNNSFTQLMIMVTSISFHDYSEAIIYNLKISNNI